MGGLAALLVRVPREPWEAFAGIHLATRAERAVFRRFARAEDLLGRTERFCSERCMAAFLLWPLPFMRAPEDVAAREGTPDP